MNVLLTCAGRRNYLVGYFREALAGQGEVFAADARREAPALAEADRAFVVPEIQHADYVPTLVEICREHEVCLLVPLNDLELPVLARQRALFVREGVMPVVPSDGVVETCFDKAKTYGFLVSCGLPAPMTYQTLEEARKGLCKGEVVFPLMVKPRWGTASIGIDYAEDKEELTLAYRLARRRVARSIIGEVSSADPERSVLVQQRLDGTEYGLDVVNDLRGAYVTTFVKRKIGMRAGETDRAVTVCDLRLERLGETLGRRLGHVGNLDVDVIVKTDTAYVLEMNPRLGGGYPFSHVAGANLPAAFVAWATGQDPDPGSLAVRAGVRAAKCDRLVIIEDALEGGVNPR